MAHNAEPAAVGCLVKVEMAVGTSALNCEDLAFLSPTDRFAVERKEALVAWNKITMCTSAWKRLVVQRVVLAQAKYGKSRSRSRMLKEAMI